MGYFITLTNPQDVTYIEDFNLKAKEGAFAMKINSGGSINLTIDNAFYETVKCKKCTVRITYWNQAGANWKFEGKPEVVGSGSGSVETVIYTNHRFRKKTFKISATSGEPIFHMVEIIKL